MSPAAAKIKEKKPGQRACDEKNEKGEVCVGHLKRWYTYAQDEALVKELGRNAEVYRCERCHTLYRPVPNDRSSAGLKFETRPVNVLGDTHRGGAD